MKDVSVSSTVPLRVLYLGANLRMYREVHSGPQIRARGLMQALQQTGMHVDSRMAGDMINSSSARQVYTGGMRRTLPRFVRALLRDLYEMLLDRRFENAIEREWDELRPDAILQQHARYAQVGMRLARRHHIPFFLDDLTPVWEEEHHSDRSFKLWARLLRKRVFRAAAGLLAVSPAMEAHLAAEGYDRQRIFPAPNGVDMQLFDPSINAPESMRIANGVRNKVVIGYVGAIQSWHGLDLLLQAAPGVIKIYPKAHFMLILGDDPEEEVRQRVEELGLSDFFTIISYRPHPEVPAYLNWMDITVLPATHAYMSPIKIYEYMAMGKPVIAPTGNDLVETLVRHQETGLLFEAENFSALQDAIMRLAGDENLRRQMGEKSREIALQQFTWHQQSSEWIDALITACSSYQGLVSSPRAKNERQ